MQLTNRKKIKTLTELTGLIIGISATVNMSIMIFLSLQKEDYTIRATFNTYNEAIPELFLMIVASVVLILMFLNKLVEKETNTKASCKQLIFEQMLYYPVYIIRKRALFRYGIYILFDLIRHTIFCIKTIIKENRYETNNTL